MAVITISHEIGSGGREIGQMVAGQLGLPYIDNEIVQGVANRLGISEKVAGELDERADHLIDRIFSTLSFEAAGIMQDVDSSTLVNITAYQKATQEILDTVAASGKGVIAGHGANFYLAGRPEFLSVFIYAPFEARVAKVMQRERVERAAAIKMVQHSDAERCHYIKSLYGANWTDPLRYHLLVNTSLISPETATAIIVQAVQCCPPAQNPSKI